MAKFKPTSNSVVLPETNWQDITHFVAQVLVFFLHKVDRRLSARTLINAHRSIIATLVPI
jgi:hypothetical protein